MQSLPELCRTHLDPYIVTLSATSTAATSLESALAKNVPANPLECAFTKSLDLKSPEINTYRKYGGVPILRFRSLSLASFASCLSVFISVHLWFHLLPEVFYVTQAQTETR